MRACRRLVNSWPLDHFIEISMDGLGIVAFLVFPSFTAFLASGTGLLVKKERKVSQPTDTRICQLGVYVGRWSGEDGRVLYINLGNEAGVLLYIPSPTLRRLGGIHVLDFYSSGSFVGHSGNCKSFPPVILTPVLTMTSLQAAHQLFKRYEPTKKTFPLYVTSIIVTPLCIPQFVAYDASSGSGSNTYLSLCVFFLFFIGSTISYRLSPSHPLADVPGPMVFRISNLWRAYLSWTGKQHLVLKALHDEYGTVVRTGAFDFLSLYSFPFPYTF